MADPYYATGGTYKFRATITKDGAVWDLTAATVTIVFVPPYSAAEFSKTVTKENAAGGIVYYVTAAGLTPDLDVAGQWKLYFHILDGTLDLTTEPYEFSVFAR